jgi:hypothetical protein
MCISERVYEYSPMDIKLRTSTKGEMDRPLSTETECVWNIYTRLYNRDALGSL